MLRVCCCRLLLKCQSTTVVLGRCYYVTCLLLQVVTEVSEHDGCVGRLLLCYVFVVTGCY